MDFKKNLPIISYDDFIMLVLEVDTFFSVPNNKEYKVKYLEGNVMHFIRKDANQNQPWSFDLQKVYQAYVELESFNTANFKLHVRMRHSPARALIAHLNLIQAII